MNRSHTVWLDQVTSTSSTTGTAIVTTVALPVFNIELTGLTTTRQRPLTKWEILIKVVIYLAHQPKKLLALYLLYRFIRRYRQLSRSQQDTYPALGKIPPLGYITSISTGVFLYTRAWRVPPDQEIGRIFLIHGYREHCHRYEHVAQFFNQMNYSVFAMDHQGHGRSYGARGYVESFQHYIADYMHFMSLTIAQEEEDKRKFLASASLASSSSSGTHEKIVPCFMFGHSMGAMIALQIARIHEWRKEADEEDRKSSAISSARPDAISEEDTWVSEDHPSTGSPSSISSPLPATHFHHDLLDWNLTGLILSSPALVPNLEFASPLMQTLASSLADIVPRWGFTGVTHLSDYSSNSVVLRQLQRDPLVYDGPMTSRVGHELLESMSDTRNALSDVQLPLFIAQAKMDTVVSPAGAQVIYDRAASKDKTFHAYESRHDIFLEGGIKEQFFKHCKEWLLKHQPTRRPSHATSSSTSSSSSSSSSDPSDSSASSGSITKLSSGRSRKKNAK